MVNMMIPRIYTSILEDHLKNESNMAFIAGPRQCGKTTSANLIKGKRMSYWIWDDQDDRLSLRSSQNKFIKAAKLRNRNFEVLVLDEIHKNTKWKSWVKGLYDKQHDRFKIIVTGSAKLDIFQKGGDSLLGRYFLYRHHPLSIGELISSKHYETIFRKNITIVPTDHMEDLLEFGGFPAPFKANRKDFHLKWVKTKKNILVHEEIRDLTKITDLTGIEVLTELLEQRAANLLNLHNLAGDLDVSVDSVRRWLKIMERIYYVFVITPYSRSVARSLLRTPKVYLWDWSPIKNEGAKVENFMASHLLKAVHFWNDTGKGTFNLHYLRDKQKREVDFLVLRDGKPFILTECKVSEKAFPQNLSYFDNIIKPQHCFLVVKNIKSSGEDIFASKKRRVVSLADFCAALP